MTSVAQADRVSRKGPRQRWGRVRWVAVSAVLCTGTAMGSVAGSQAAPAPRTTPVTASISEWPQFRGGPTHTGAVVDSALTRSALTHLTAGWRMTGTRGLVVSGGIGYLYAGDGISAIRVSDSSEVWHVPFPSLGYGSDSLSVADGVLVVAQAFRISRHRLGESVSGVDAATGRVLWQRSYTTSSSSPPTLAGGSVLITYGRGLEKLDLATGAVTWTSTRWANSSPAVVGNTVVVAQPTTSKPYDLHGVDLTTGATTWVRPLRHEPVRWSVIAHDVAYTATTTTGLLATRLPNGTSAWSSTARASYGVAVVGDQLVGAGAGRAGLTGLDRRTGAITWHDALPTNVVAATPPVVVGDTVIVGTMDLSPGKPQSAALEMRDLATGAFVGSLDLRTVVPGANGVTDLFVAEGHVFVQVFDGHNDVTTALAPA